MSISNNSGRTLSGIDNTDINGLNLPSTIDAIRIGGDVGTLRQVVGKDAISNKVKWLDITDTQIEDDSIVPRMIDSSANFTFTDVNCRNLSAVAVDITTALTLPDLTATNLIDITLAGVQVWSINNTGLMKFIKDATADPVTTYTTINQGLITTEKTLTTTESLWGPTASTRKFEIDSATGNIYQYEAFDPRNEYFSVVEGAGAFRSISIANGGLVNTGAFTTTGLSTFAGNINQVGDLAVEGDVTFTKLTTGDNYTLDITQGQANFGGNIKTTNISTGTTALTGTINCFDLVASNKITTTDISITGRFDFSGSLDLNSIEAHSLKIKTLEDDEKDDADVFVVEGEVKTAPFYRQVKLFTGLELYDRVNLTADQPTLRITMDMVTGIITATGGFTGNLFAFQTGSINGELLCSDITARNGANGRFFVDTTLTADKGSVELIGDYYGQNFFITNNGRILDSSLDPPAPGTKLISLKQDGDIDCINLTATTKIKAETLETTNLIYTGNIDLGDIKARSLTIETDADVSKITLSSTTGTIKGINSEAGNNHQLDRLDIQNSLTFQTTTLATTLSMLQTTGSIKQFGTGGLVQSVATTEKNILQLTEIAKALICKSTISSVGSITAGGQVICKGIDSNLGGSIDGEVLQINRGAIIENPPPTTDPPTPEGFALIVNGKSQFNQEVDFLSSVIDFGALNDLINTDVVNFFGHDLDLFGSTMKLYKMSQSGTDLPAEIRTFDNTSLPPVATGTILSSEGYVESKDFRPTKKIQYQYSAENGNNELFGASATHRTICKNLDLSDDSNVLPVNPVSLEFGIYYSPIPAVGIESDDEDWKYWGDNLYVRKPAYSDPSLTTLEIDMTYNIRNDAFGNFFIGLASSTNEGVTKTFVPESDQFCPRVSAPGIGSMRNQFTKRYQVVIQNQTYNQEILYYPVFRTNTNNDDGLIRVEHGGNGTTLTNPACVIRGRPWPSFFRQHRTPDFAGGLI